MVDRFEASGAGEALKGLLPDPAATPGATTAEALRAAQDALLHRPGSVRSLIQDEAFIGAVVRAINPDAGEAQSWLYQAWIWEFLADGLGRVALLPGEEGLMAPLLSRRRFLHLAQAQRRPLTLQTGFDGTGTDVRNRLVGTSPDGYWAAFGEARRAWASYLTTYQSHVVLTETVDDIEAEVKNAIFVDPGKPEAELLTAGDQPDRADLAVALHLYESLLLPRFDLRTGRVLTDLASRMNHPERSGSTRGRWRYVIPALLALLSVAWWLVPWASAGLWAVISSVLALAVMAAFSLVGGRLESSNWLLRLPASTIVGLFLLLSFGSGWLTAASTGSPHTMVGVFGLLLASFAYLVLEVRNHDVDRRTSLNRSAMILIIGLGYSAVISTIGLIGLAPAIINTKDLSPMLDTGGPAMFWSLATATALNLTFGVFSQILWDDKSITAPLAHSTWTTS